MNILFFDILAIIILIITPTTTGHIYMIKAFLFILLIMTNMFVFAGYFPVPNVNITTVNTTTTPVASSTTPSSNVTTPGNCDGSYASGYKAGVASNDQTAPPIIILNASDVKNILDMIKNSNPMGDIKSIHDGIVTAFVNNNITVTFTATTPGTTPGATTTPIVAAAAGAPNPIGSSTTTTMTAYSSSIISSADLTILTSTISGSNGASNIIELIIKLIFSKYNIAVTFSK